MKMSDVQRCNKVTMLCHGIIGAIISAAYVIEVLKGSRTLLYLAVLMLLALGPVAVEAAIYKKNPESDILRKVVGYSYAVMYIMVVFTTTSKLPFTYVLPMLIVITLYGDIKYCLRIGVGAVIINVVDVAYRAISSGGFAQEELPDIEIRVIVMIVIVIYLYFTTKVSQQINQDKQHEIEEEKEKAERLLNQVMRLSGELSGGMEQVDDQMSRLDKSVEEMSVAMGEVATGTQETAESVQNQLTRTQEIQKLIADVSEVGVFIRERMDAASGEMESGVAGMKLLSNQSKQSREANATVVRLMTELHTQAEKMNEIIGLISSIANKTSMLALNANIEAARAGEAGASFSVVAKQVNELAQQTKDSTVNITDLIVTITDELNQVTDAVKVVEDNTAAQDERTEELSRNLDSLRDMTSTIAEKTIGLEKMIGDLAAANGDIVQNIQVISAITEEVTAHSSETLNTCRENQEIVDKVSKITAKLNENAHELNRGNMQ